MLIGLLAAVAAAAPLARPEAEPVPTVITNVTVLHRDGTVSGPDDVWLQEGEVAWVTAAGSPPPFAPERVVDGTGAFLMPGLVDLHVHLGSTTAVPGRIRVPSPRRNLDALLFAGVTTVLDLSSPIEDVQRWRRRLEAGRWAGPEIVATGRPFGAPEGHPRTSVLAMFPSFLVKMTTGDMAWEVESAADVDAAWDSEGPRAFAKVMLDSLPPGAPTIADAALERLRERASADGTPIVAHVGSTDDVARALALPVDALVHSPHTGPITPEQAAGMAREGIPVVPTLAVWQAFQDIEEARPAIGPLERQTLPGPVLRDLERAAAGEAPVEGAMDAWSASLVAGRPTRMGNVATLREAGVAVLVGSDSPGLGIAAGAGTHREIALLVEAGMTPIDALVAATSGNRRFLDPERWCGVNPGCGADLLLVRGDPTLDVTATTDIAAVWIDGRLVRRRPREASPPDGQSQSP